MAENEYLDSRIGRRWQPVVQALRHGVALDEVKNLVEDCLFKELRKIQKEQPFAEMIRALDNHDELFRLCQGDSNVEAVIMQAALESGSRQSQLERFLRFALENCLFDIPQMVVKPDGSMSITEVRVMLDGIRSGLSEEISQLAQRLAEDPDKIPSRRGRGRPVQSKEERTEKMLKESLL